MPIQGLSPHYSVVRELGRGSNAIVYLAVDARSGSAAEEHLSTSGIVVGTPRYMSPEQALRDRPLDGRSDVYALGCVTYEMLTGEPPFSETNVLTLVAAHAARAPRALRTVRPDVSEDTGRIIVQAMAKEVVERPDSAGAFSFQLRQSIPDLSGRR